MNGMSPFELLRQRAYRHSLEDGTADIIVGTYMLLVGGATQKRVFIALALVYLIILSTAWKFISHEVSSRRIGYAELPEDPPKTLLTAVMVAGVLSLLLVGAITLSTGDAWNLAHWPNWTPLVAGAILAGGFGHVALRSGLWRYRSYVAATLGVALFFWLFPFGPRINASDRLTLLFFVLAALLLVAGITVLVRFVRSRPILPVEESDE